ncbi:MAG: hypothetical protein K2V38_09505 [Gemmataceae bacterium]|nr:hypothetical protein [Gemmataceae bacterium]
MSRVHSPSCNCKGGAASSGPSAPSAQPGSLEERLAAWAELMAAVKRLERLIDQRQEDGTLSPELNDVFVRSSVENIWDALAMAVPVE